MLRTIFVLTIALVGAGFALRGSIYALMFYLWIAYFRPQEWVWTDFITAMNLSFIAGAYLLVISLFSARRFPFNWRVVLLLLVAVQGALSLVESRYSTAVLPFYQDFLKSLVITYLIMVIVRDRASIRLALLALAVSLALEPAKQGWIQFVIAPGSKNFNSIGFLGDENGTAIGMLMLTPLLGALAALSDRPWQKWGLRFLLVGVLYRAIITYSRGGFLGAGAMAGLWFLRSKQKVGAAVAMAIVLLAIVPVLPDSFWERMGTITTSEREMDASAAGRLHFWRVAVKMANDNPIFGVGHAAYSYAFDDYDTTIGEYGESRAVHSSWFGILAEWGYPGLILFIGMIVATWLACYKVRHIARGNGSLAELGRYAVAFESALLVFVVSGSFVSFQYTEMLWHLFGFSTALLLIAQAESTALVAVPEAAVGAARPGLPVLTPFSPKPAAATSGLRWPYTFPSER